MTRRLAAPMCLALAALALAGCSVGRFIAGAPAPGGAADASGAVTSASAGTRSGPAILVRRCGGCHEIPKPAEMSAAEWRSGLTRMKLRMRLPAWEWDSLAAIKPDTTAGPGR